MKTAKEHLDDFIHSTLHGINAPEIQKQEMSKAFLCGYLRCFTLMAYEITTLSDEAAELRLCELESELHKLLGISPPRPKPSGN